MYQNRIEIIDAHCHIYPAKIAAKAAISVGNFYKEEPACGGTTEELIQLGDSVGVDRFVVQSVATAPKQVASINGFIADEVARSNGRFIGFGTLHPESEDIKGDLEHLKELGLKGVKLHPDIQGFKIDDYRCLKIYELCEGRLPILMHTGDHRFDFSNPNRMKPVLEKYPELTVVGAHFGGWSVWEDATRQLSGYKNFLVDCSSSLYAITPEKAKELIFIYGVERVLFGTDYPLWTPESEIERFMRIDLTDEQREDILYNNAAKLFGI